MPATSFSAPLLPCSLAPSFYPSRASHRLTRRATQPIIGVRYQCANCPSYPKSVSLVRHIHPQTLELQMLTPARAQCERCEARSYALHDPWHVFFKLPKPVDQPLILQPPLPKL